MRNAIEIANFYYQNLFENFSLCIQENSFSVLSGPNNCGKTTLIRVLNREIITESDIHILGDFINTYEIDTYSKMVGCVIPLEYIPKENNLEEELNRININSKDKRWILKSLRITRMTRKKINDLSLKEQVLFHLAVVLAKKPRILLVDTISSYFTKNEVFQIVSFLKEYQEKEKITVLYIARDLEESLIADTLHIMSDRKICLEGSPLEVLEKDNIINKIGLRIPFMIDLSVKLKDYEVIEELYLEKDRMVNKLWKSE